MRAKGQLQWRVDADTAERFVVEYLKDFNPEAAFKRTWPQFANSAKLKGPRLIARNPWIAEQIRERSQGRITLADITPERVKLACARIAFSDPRKTLTTTMGSDGPTEMPLPVAGFDDDTAEAIKGIRYDKYGNRSLEMHDKSSALMMLAKMTGAVPDFNTLAGGRHADSLNHDATSEDEIMRILAELEDPDDEVDMGEDGEIIDMNEELEDDESA